MKPYRLIAAFGAVTLHAAAQQATPSRPDDPSAVVPGVVYESPFKGYVRYREEPSRPWREVNEEVARAGGHAGILGGSGHAHSNRSSFRSGDAAAPPDRKASDKPATHAQTPQNDRHQGH
jgi:hypothetical protein